MTPHLFLRNAEKFLKILAHFPYTYNTYTGIVLSVAQRTVRHVPCEKVHNFQISSVDCICSGLAFSRTGADNGAATTTKKGLFSGLKAALG
jgi:hypothetical protein